MHKGKKKLDEIVPNPKNIRKRKQDEELFVKQLRSRGVIIQERRQKIMQDDTLKSTSSIKLQGDAATRKYSSDLYRSINNMSNTGNKCRGQSGVGIYSLDNNLAIINVSKNLKLHDFLLVVECKR